MTKQIEAVYENGVLRPLSPLPLGESQHVTLSVTLDSPPPERACPDTVFVEQAREGIRGLDRIPSLEEVREMLSGDPKSWAEAITGQREDRI